MAWASNWFMVRSICAEVNFIAQSFRLSSCYSARRRRFMLRALPPQGGQTLVDLSRAESRRRIIDGAAKTAARSVSNYTSRPDGCARELDRGKPTAIHE